MKYSFYESRFSTKCRQVTVAELLEIIGKPALKEMCEKIVEAMKVGDDEEVEKLKSKMPGVVVSELYKAGAPRIAGTGEPTGLVMIDYDYCKTEEELKELCEKVQRLSIVHPQLKDLIVAAHISQRRHGVHVWFRWIDGCQTVEECQAKFAEMADLPGYDTDCTGVNRFCGLVHKSMFLDWCTSRCSLYRTGERWNVMRLSLLCRRKSGKTELRNHGEAEKRILRIRKPVNQRIQVKPFSILITRVWRIRTSLRSGGAGRAVNL